MGKKIGKILLFVFPVVLVLVMVLFLAPQEERPEGIQPNETLEPVASESIVQYELSGSNYMKYTFAGKPYIYVVFELQNTGTVNIELDTAEFCLYDANGNLMDVTGLCQAYPNIIEPGELAYYAQAIADDYDVPINNITLQNKCRATEKKCQYLEVSNDSIVEKERGMLKGSLTITNNTSQVAEMVHSFCVIRDQSRKIVALLTGSDYENLRSGSSFSTTVYESTLTKEILDTAGFSKIYSSAFAFVR